MGGKYNRRQWRPSYHQTIEYLLSFGLLISEVIGADD